MREHLIRLIDKPVVLRTGAGARGSVGRVDFRVAAETLEGVVFEVGETTVDILVDGAGVMKTVRIDAIVDAAISQFMARQMGGVEDPPEHDDWPRGKRLLFEAEEAINLHADPAPKAARAVEALRNVRRAFPRHRGVARRLERAHFLATGRYDYEPHEEVTGGEVEDGNYAEAKDLAAKLESSLRVRRPEEEIAILLPRIARHAGRALANYPNHAELRSWFRRAEEIRGKLSERMRKLNSMEDPFQAGKS